MKFDSLINEISAVKDRAINECSKWDIIEAEAHTKSIDARALLYACEKMLAQLAKLAKNEEVAENATTD